MFDGRGLIGGRLGAYRIVQEIGRGGMGAVYLATRDDDQYRKQVAIKVVKRGMDTAEVLERFRHERQILANLEHPYIARLIDGGTTADGRPFFVMDYVEGVPVDVFCRERALCVKERCQLFLRICEAVSHAHRNLVVHRDLKPGNIFVTADGTPKLLDFGVAKLLSTDAGSGITATMATRPLTPEYASPEQVHGLPVTTSTDVYSLGAILYELLTGQRAQSVASAMPLEIERAVCEAAVKRPSTVKPGLDSDLDNIVLMAMRKEPERRYHSVDQLAEEVRRHLDGRPVEFGYRARKFLRRNRGSVAATALFLAVLAGGATATALEARRAEQQRQIAVRRFEQVSQLAGKFLLDFHDAIAALPGSTSARKMVVETGLQYYDTLVKEAQGNRDLLEEIARGYDRLGDVQGNPYYANLGDAAGAMASYQKALEVRTSVSDDSPRFLAERIGGSARIAQMLALKGDVPSAQSRLREAIQTGEHSLSSGSRVVQEALANAYRASGDLHFRTGDYASAIEPYTKLLGVWTQLASEPRDPIGERAGISLAHTKLADSYVRLHRAGEALEHLRIAESIDKDLAATNPNSVPRLRKLYIDYTLLSLVFRVSPTLDAVGEGRRVAESAASWADRMAAADPNNSTALFDVMTAQTLVGDWLRDHGELAASVDHYRKAVDTIERFASTSPPALLTDDALIYAHQRLAAGLGKAGRLPQALSECHKAEQYIAQAEKRNPGLLQTASRRPTWKQPWRGRTRAAGNGRWRRPHFCRRARCSKIWRGAIRRTKPSATSRPRSTPNLPSATRGSRQTKSADALIQRSRHHACSTITLIGPIKSISLTRMISSNRLSPICSRLPGATECFSNLRNKESKGIWFGQGTSRGTSSGSSCAVSERSPSSAHHLPGHKPPPAAASPARSPTRKMLLSPAST
jgi:tetratricopeptide (TPR) repeat protein